MESATVDVTDLAILILAGLAAWASYSGWKGLFLWAKRLPCDDYDGSATATPSPSGSEDGERPHLPPAIIIHLALSDRLDRRAGASIEEIEGLRLALQNMRDTWMVEDAIREIEGEAK